MLPRLPGIDTGKSKVLYHWDDPVWRMVITPQRAFVSSYATEDQAWEQPVLEIQDGESSLHASYKRYFDFLWMRLAGGGATAYETREGLGPYDRLEQGVRAVVYHRDARGEPAFVVLTRKDDLTVLPKGHPKPGETEPQALFRELKEEAGLKEQDLQIGADLGWFSNPIVVPEGEREIKVVHYFLVEATGDSPPALKVGPDHKAAVWRTREQLKELRFAYAHVDAVLRAVEVHLPVDRG